MTYIVSGGALLYSLTHISVSAVKAKGREYVWYRLSSQLTTKVFVLELELY